MTALVRNLVIAGASLGLSLSTADLARAHAIESTLTYLNGDLQLRSNFSTGSPAAGAVVRLLKADGSKGAELGQMDANGTLQLALPVVRQGTLDIQIDGGPGHRDYLALPIEQGQVQLDAVSQDNSTAAPWLALLGGSGAGLGLYGCAALVGRVNLSRIG